MKKSEYYMNIVIICLTICNKIDILKKYKTLEEIKEKVILEECNECLLDLFCQYGLDKNDEPNECGHVLEDIIDYINSLVYCL